MNHKRTAAMLLALCLVLSLCACTGGEAVPETSKVPAPPAPTSAAQPPEESPEGSYMRLMELTPQEQFYLGALSPTMHNCVYEIHLEDEYTKFQAYVYKLGDGEWHRVDSFWSDIESDTCYLAVSHELTEFNIALKNGNSFSHHYSEQEDSAFDSYTWDVDLVEFLPISPVEGNSLVAYVDEDEMPLIAYRRMPSGELRPASVEDFYAPENVEAGEIEEYYMLTVQFIR